MSNVVKTFRKTAAERRRLYLNYECWLGEPEILTDFQATVSPLTSSTPLTLSIAYTDAAKKKLTMFAGGGLANTGYVVSMLVRTDAGQIKQDDIGIRVTP